MAENNEEIKKMIEEHVKKILPTFLTTNAFTLRKVTDTPTDDLQVVNRKYVNMYGSTLGRPTNSVFGQQYFDSSIGRPIFLRTDGKWVDGAGSIS